MHGSGKTTVCEHLARLACNAVHFASLSSTALLVRILQDGICTLLIDEVDRSLDADKPGVKDLLAVLNSGYKVGATRPVLVPAKGNRWTVEKMPTFAPVVLSGNSPRLPDDTRSRCIRILLMPDLGGTVEDSDWEEIGDEADKLRDKIALFADAVRIDVRAGKVDLPTGCTGRVREKWRPLKRVAVAAGGSRGRRPVARHRRRADRVRTGRRRGRPCRRTTVRPASSDCAARPVRRLVR